MVDEFASVFGHRVGYLSNAHPIFAREAQHSRFLFVHDTHTPHCNGLSSKTLSGDLEFPVRDQPICLHCSERSFNGDALRHLTTRFSSASTKAGNLSFVYGNVSEYTGQSWKPVRISTRRREAPVAAKGFI
jgi:hypothetical protein